MAYTEKQIIDEIERYGDQAHAPETLAQWDVIDSYYKRTAEIEMPEATKGDTGDLESLKRLFIRTNFARTIVNSTVTMVMASGLPVIGRNGQRDEALERLLVKTDIRKLMRYTSRYGAAWIQAVPDDQIKKYRIYKPHIARRIMAQEDQEREQAVLVIQKFERKGQEGTDEPYYVARWYEWNDDNTAVTRKDYIRDSSAWRRRPSENIRRVPYMPFIYVPNREDDTIPEQSDLHDGIDIFKQYDALRVKFLKALEDESFRIIFLSSVGDDVANRIKKAGGLELWYAKNKVGEEPPTLQSVPPADQRQFLEALKDLVDSLATVSRTSVLELNERPVQDIPAQTLRVLYGPQIERCTETAEHLNPALTRLLSVIASQGGIEVRLEPRLPISEDKAHQNMKGLLDSDAYSAKQLLIDSGKTEQEAMKIIDDRMEEKRRKAEIETAAAVQVAEAEARARAVARPTPAQT